MEEDHMASQGLGQDQCADAGTLPALAMIAPPLPQEVSADGREIWDWAARLSQHTHRLQRRRELSEDILRIGRECGSCYFWMTRDCPREVHDNRLGRKRGPSMKAPICSKFTMNSQSAGLKAKWEAEFAEVQAALSPARATSTHPRSE